MMLLAATPVVQSPALPADLLTYIVQDEAYPTTLIICCSQTEFLQELANGVGQAQGQEAPTSTDEAETGHADKGLDNASKPEGQTRPRSSLLSAPLYQVAVARHIRMVFVLTVSHLRAFLSVFSPEDTKIPQPPVFGPARQTCQDGDNRRQPLLLVYGFLNLHRDTSEWSAQGLSSTAAGLVEAARRAKFQAVVLDPPARDSDDEGLKALWIEDLPVLSTGARRAGANLDDGAWTGRTVKLGRILGRWFRVSGRDWPGSTSKTPQA